MLVEQIAEMIAKERGHKRELCNDKCHCFRLAVSIVALIEVAYSADGLAEMLDQRTTKLQRLQRLVGEAT